MINIRSNVFETNSSSSHSVSIEFEGKTRFNSKSPSLLGTIAPNSLGQIHLNGGDFTRNEFELCKPIDKANLVATYCIVYNDNKLKESFEKIVKEQTGATEIVYNIRLTSTADGEVNTFYMPRMHSAWFYSSSYDDDADEDEGSLKDVFLNPEQLRVFLFCNDIYLSVGIHEC